jgi:hypothetical protein
MSLLNIRVDNIPCIYCEKLLVELDLNHSDVQIV